jgi:hypothetical protein
VRCARGLRRAPADDGALCLLPPSHPPPLRRSCQSWTYWTLNVNTFHSTNNTSLDPCWCGSLPAGQCVYYALVSGANGYPVEGAVLASVYYSYPTGNGSDPGPGVWVPLLDGVPTGGATMSQGEYSYFTFAARFTGPGSAGGSAELVLSAVPTLGDADLFVTLDGSVPSSSNYNFLSVRGKGADVVSLRASDARVAQLCAAAIASNTTCLVRIAVHGWSISSDFIMTASFNRFTTLLPGVPFAGIAPGYAGGAVTTGLAYYRYTIVSAGDGVALTLTPSAGSPWMWVAAGTNGSSVVPPPSPVVPSSWGWSAPAGGGAPLTLVPGVTPGLGGCGVPCTLLIAVGPGPNGTDASAAGFSLLAAASGANGTTGAPLLPLGADLFGVVSGGAYSRYVLPWPSPDVYSVTITADGTDGWPWLMGAFLVPTVDLMTFDYLSYNYGPYFSRIWADADQPGGPYATYCANRNASVTSGASRGGASSASVAAPATSPDGSVIDVAALAAAQAQPTSAAVAPAYGPLAAAPTPLPGAPGCPLYVGVYGNTAPSTVSRFIVSAFTTQQALPQGVPVPGTVEPVGYTRYLLTVPDRTPLSITVSPSAGDPDLLVAASGGDATTSNYQWSSTVGGLGAESVTITWAEPVWATLPPDQLTFPFTFHISVYGWDGPAQFTITAVGNGPLPLVDGVPLSAPLAPGALTYFSYTVPALAPGDNTTDLSWSLDAVPLSGSPSAGGIVAWVTSTRDAATNATVLPRCTTDPCNPAAGGGAGGGPVAPFQ